MQPTTVNVFLGGSINDGDSLFSKVVVLEQLPVLGAFSVQLDQTSDGGTGVVKLELLCSNDGSSFTIPLDKDGTAIHAIAEANPDGVSLYAFPPFPVCKAFQLKATASGANVSEFNGIVVVQ
jgi:hypothetical protein